MALQYQLALLNVEFDSSYNDVIRFNSREEQEAYFKVDELFSTATFVNLNVSSFYRTTLTYNSNAGDDLANQMNYNYCIVKDNNIEAKTKYFYYFINETRYTTNRQVQLSVELDVFNTYFMDLDIDACLIERAHLNRFKRSVHPNQVTFKWGVNSCLYEREPITPTTKYLKSRSKFRYEYDKNESGSVLNSWINNSGVKWVYIFLADKKDGYNNSIYLDDAPSAIVTPFRYSNKPTNDVDLYPFEQPYYVLCYPIYGSGDLKVKYYGRTAMYKVTGQGTNDFIALNGGFANVITAKISTLSPFEVDTYSSDPNAEYAISNEADGSIVMHPNALSGKLHNLKIFQVDKSSEVGNRAIIQVQSQNFIKELFGYIDEDVLLNFNTVDVKAKRELRFNPKLYGSDYFNIRLTNGNNIYDYDLSKLSLNGYIRLIRTEVISPDITKQYARLKPSADSVYSQDTTKNFTGLVSNLDYAMPYSVNNLDTYIANNKNFFMQSLVRSESALGMGAIAATGAYLMASNPIPAMGLAAATAGASAIGNVINTTLQKDNMESAPERLANANSNGIFNIAVTGGDLYLEKYDTLDNEKHILDDYMHLYGFTYNRVDRIDNVFNIRKNFNYVKANVDIIRSTKPISNEVKRRIREVFMKGVTFWNVAPVMFKHDVANYERWLDD